jgi:peptide/nickel transport system permease protein
MSKITRSPLARRAYTIVMSLDVASPPLKGGGTSFAAYVARRVVAVAVVVVVTPALTYVLFGSLREGVSVTDKVAQLPGYLSDTFLHLDFGYAPRFHKPRGQVLLDTMPVDIALLVGSLVCGVVIGLAAGVIGGARRRSAADRALAVGSAIGMSMPVYWFSSIALVLFAPQSGYLLQVPFLSWYGGYVPFHDSPLRWLQSLWVPWLVLAAPLAAMVYRMTRASLAEVLSEDFVRTARAKGLRERIVLRRHALRAALTPVIGLVSVNVALLVTNVIVIERAFNLPGFFRLASIGQFNGLDDREPHISVADVQALIVEASLLIAVTMFLADVLRAKLDPRERT